MAELGMIRPWEMEHFTAAEYRALDASRRQLETEYAKARRG